MYWKSFLAITAIAPNVNAAGATLRFSCSQLTVERLDPIINAGVVGSPHLHQIVGGNAFNASMSGDVSTQATCTSCTPTEDFPNYWTATLFFRARNGTFKRVNTLGNPLGFGAATGGQTVYYLSSGKVTAFKPGFRMTVGDPSIRTDSGLKKYPQLQFTCLQTSTTRTGYQDNSRFFYETYWDTTPFNNKAEWPVDGSQPFVWSFGDVTGYGNHADYVFGWKGDALQRAMDANCNSDLFTNSINCATLKTQTIQQANQCTKSAVVNDNLGGWLTELPGGVKVNRL
ncbi:hypothetical protein LSUE1_G007994 [Lachnellula suecica]|uniref:DUF1996 domain-containing protein n=1 Tax=Lachnellula suecica TaxID=602035 RepID=A0A8T9CDQ8_9HELO|nr:hypothetical protein LSUE1_G007994 [Lachnellula suecica]